ncbi:hypothetical protein BOTBODRAFT_197088 [Botryobasidium botryosum FD-172 SS1]|uniref:Conserved oligomeric Golgi complex subunit 2 n=1 Tax=Botryobasidium botryosum (strain FD-172 SS1) TaxID=930990 RepID=A0A067MZU7_BOTB1|nr:hypothetical protein BOTBODRAFT_197088 [Botryobasidium botryosum FD-172 SS1]
MAPAQNQDATSSNDPYQLDRLAEVQAARSNGASSEPTHHELPAFVPLSHEHPLLSSAEPFDVDAFLLTRTHTKLPDLRTELREYLALLKEELVQLINDDYAAFISLSTDLRGEGATLDRLKWPLGSVKAEVEKSRAELQNVQDAVQQKLAERNTLREEKALLHLLLKLSDSVVRLESLLLIPSPQDAVDGQPRPLVDHSSMGVRDVNGLLTFGTPTNTGEDEPQEERSRRGRAKHLSRVAAEYTQLLYHAEKARSEKCAFVDQLQWRMDRIKSTLSKDLDHLFSTILSSLTSSTASETSSGERARWTAELTECISTYDVLGSWSDAEEVIRRDLVRPFVKKTIFSGALSAPLSPIIPRTPFPNPSAYPLSPRTPFTPFPAMPDPFASQFRLSAHDAAIPLLQDEDSPLSALLNNVLQFVAKNCGGVMDVAENIMQRSNKLAKGKLGSLDLVLREGGPEKGDGDEGPQQGFQIMARVVWAEIGKAVMDELGSAVFAVGRPDDFQKNYSIVHEFIAALEYLAPSAHSVEAMRAHPSFIAFERRWQLPVYFQLRWKDIVGKLEDVLGGTIDTGSFDKNGFVTFGAAAIWDAAKKCWASDVYIPELGYRFWRLTLQLVVRYKTWLDATLPLRESAGKATAAITNEKPGTPLGGVLRSGTPVPAGESTENAEADEAMLQQFAAGIIDIMLLERNVRTLWSDQISHLLPPNEADDEAETPEAVLNSMLETLSAMVPELAAQIVAVLIRRCSDTLGLVRSIPSQYRAMSNKRDPTEPSYFVPNILRPVRVFFEHGGPGESLRQQFGQQWTAEVFESVALKYAASLSSMKKTEDSLRRYKKGKKSGFSLFGVSASSQNEEERDEGRVRAQMMLDVQGLARDAASLGVDVEKSPAYESLRDMAAQSNTPV